MCVPDRLGFCLFLNLDLILYLKVRYFLVENILGWNFKTRSGLGE